VTYILVVDDEPTIRQVIAEILQDEGFEVVIAADGEQLFEQVRISQPALILLDVMMPGMSGIAILEKLRTQAQITHIPVVLMSAGVYLTEIGDPIREFLPKPFDLKQLLDIVHRMLGPATPEPNPAQL
jgi:CheY-like chemotaxis protein